MAQTLTTIHASSGLRATASAFRIEPDGLRPSGSRGEVVTLRVTSTAPSLIQRILPTFVLHTGTLDIPDRYDAVFFAEAKVLRVRIHLKVNDSPLSKQWPDQIRAYFKYLDRDADGYLNRYEAELLFSHRAMQQLLQTGFANPNLTDAGRTFAQLDLDQDGRISPDELIAYYAPVVRYLVQSQFTNNAADVVSPRLTDGMFKLFDRDKDGKLSRAELQQLDQLIPQLDQNEDECLTNLELVPDLFRNIPPATPAQPAGSKTGLSPFQVFPAGAIPESLVEQIYQRYDKDKNLRISKAESPFSDAMFAKLDKDTDGHISLSEMLQWRQVDADLNIDWTLGSKPSDCKVVVLPGSDGKPPALANTVRIAENGGAFIRVGNQNLELGSTSFGVTRVQTGNAFQNLFQQADSTNRGYFTEKDIGGPQFQFLRILFDVMDENMDGKVTRAEFDRYFVVQNSFVELPLRLGFGSYTPSLFALLDTNHDGRLSVPELRAAWDHLKDLEPGGGEYITRAAIQPHGQLKFSRNNMNFVGFQPGVPSPDSNMTQLKGPLWFRKMDRNADGVISRSEFPGRAEEFDKLDTNHDNLIDFEEAQAADKKLRTPAGPKREAAEGPLPREVRK